MESNTDNNPNALTPINLMSSILDSTEPPYSCCSHLRNPDLEELEKITYQEDYDPIECDKCNCNIVGAYWKSLPYEEGMEIICQKDYEKLPKEPPQLKELLEEIKKYEKLEKDAGIIHLHNYYHWADCTQQIPVPELNLNFPNPSIDDGAIN
jgi:hypothetical protein